MTRVQKLREARESHTIAWRSFLIDFGQYGQAAYYCFFEGQDVKYYGVRLDALWGNSRPRRDYSCGGKRGVLRVHTLVSQAGSDRLAASVFFLDRDFGLDAPSDLENTYVTDCYAIENLYVSPDAFYRLMSAELDGSGIENWPAARDALVRRYRARLLGICTFLLPVNARLSAIRRRDLREGNDRTLSVNGVVIRKYIKATLAKVESSLTEELIKEILPANVEIEPELMKTAMDDLLEEPVYARLRGKFLLALYVGILSDFILDCNDSGIYAGKKCSTKLTIQEGNALSQLSQYADTPESLRIFALGHARQ